MADYERKILEFYQLEKPYPTTWPADKNEGNSSDDDDQDGQKARVAHRKSRYQALERAISNRRSFIPGAEQSVKGGVNLVQKDEPDPLGTTESVVRSLRQLGLPVMEDSRLRNRFLLSSTTFQPATFLSQVHSGADTRTLLNGLQVLSRSIDQKSASLKVLVETNFERFVKAKATIDNVYREMKYRGAATEPPPVAPSNGRGRGHSRAASKSSFRNSTIAPLSQLSPAMIPDSKRKNALIKESEYGVAGIKTPLLDVVAKAEVVWGPALEGLEKEEQLKTVVAQLDKLRDLVELSAAIGDSIRRKDYESLVDEYARARRFVDETRQIAASLEKQSAPTDEQLQRIVLAGRLWFDVEDQISALKRTVWKRLVSTHHIAKTDDKIPGAAAAQDRNQHMTLISLLLELGVDENPIWVWLQSRLEFLKAKVQTTSDRARVEIEVLRRRLANSNIKPTPEAIASHLEALGRQTLDVKRAAMDEAEIIDMWERMTAFLLQLLGPQGILAEVVDYWHTVQGFLDGKAQLSLPIGYNGESRPHHSLDPQRIAELTKGTIDAIEAMREQLSLFFTGLPPEDVSLLVSPLPLSPSSPGDGNPFHTRDPRFNLEPGNIPLSPRLGESWEKFAFWPPWANSVSGVHYLAKMLVLVGAGASDMASIAPVKRNDPQLVDRLRVLVGTARERCVTALCAAWNRDAENIKLVEDWQRSQGPLDVTRMPNSFAAFEGRILAGMQKILYLSEAMAKPGADNSIVLPPQSKLLQMVRSQYVTTLYKALSGMVENAERPVKQVDDDWTIESDSGVLASVTGASGHLGRSVLDPADRNVRMLLTLSNLQALRSTVVPTLNSQFENAFSVKLSDESKTIKDVLNQIDAKLFKSYTQPFVDHMRHLVQTGIRADDWAPPAGSKPTGPRPYVYDCLLRLVLVHFQVSTTAPTLTGQVLSYLLEQLTREMADAMRLRPRYPLEFLIQATLDVEFVAHTLALYTTPVASELQSGIYAELDSRTDDDARASLQGELPDMRNLLKKLREASKAEFACFRKQKRQPTQDTPAAAAAGGGSTPNTVHV